MPYTLLVADHNPSQFELFDLIFHADGYLIESFTDGEEVLAYLREHTPDVAILETDTPRVDGFDLCRKMKSVKRLREVPIILVSSKAMLTDEAKGLAKVVKADLIIPKPLGDKNLRERVKTLLEGRTPHVAVQPEPDTVQPNDTFAEELQHLESQRQSLHASLLPTDRSQEPREMKKLRALIKLQEEQIRVLEARRQELEAQLARQDKEPSRLRRWLT